jgi:UDP-glucose 4-epimerase
MEHVLVTGGAGFIGSHLVEHLIESGHRVTVFDDLSTGSRDHLSAAFDAAPERLRLAVGDVRLPLAPQLEAVVSIHGAPTRIVHLAAQVSVPQSMAEPMHDRAINLDGGWNVLDFARTYAVAKVVLASSAAVYGDVALPAAEGAVPQPESPYGIHKLGAEHYARMVAASYGIPTINLRFFNVFGPRQSPRSGYAGVMSIFIDRALHGEPLVIFGDGEQTRDFVWVGDIVRAIVAALFGGPGDGRAINVGTGQALSLNTLAAIVRTATGTDVPIVHGPPRPGDIVHSRADVGRLANDLRLVAHTDRAAGVAATARWMQGGRASLVNLDPA